MLTLKSLVVLAFCFSFILGDRCRPSRPHRPLYSAGECFIACYSHEHRGSHVGGGIYSIGFLKVRGDYNIQGVCLPAGYEAADISADNKFKKICSKNFNCSNMSCWAGGDTKTAIDSGATPSGTDLIEIR